MFIVRVINKLLVTGQSGFPIVKKGLKRALGSAGSALL